MTSELQVYTPCLRVWDAATIYRVCKANVRMNEGGSERWFRQLAPIFKHTMGYRLRFVS